MIKSGVEGGVESIPQAIKWKTRLIVIFDCFHSWQFVLVNPIHEFPRSLALVGDLLNLNIKNDFFVVLTVFLNDFQSLRLLNSLYLLRDRLQSSFHNFLECFIMFTFLALAFHTYSILAASKLIASSKDSWFKRFKVLRNLMIEETSLTNAFFSSLFFGSESFAVWTNSSSIEMVTVRGAWSEVSRQSRWIIWLLSSLNPLWRNIRSITESDSPIVLEYLVRTGLVGSKRSKLNESAKIKKSLLMEE